MCALPLIESERRVVIEERIYPKRPVPTIIAKMAKERSCVVSGVRSP